MAYTPTNWQTGDTITAERLNKLENGVSQGGGSGLFKITVTRDEQQYTADKTFNEIMTAFESGMLPVISLNGMVIPLTVYTFVDEDVTGFQFDTITVRDAVSYGMVACSSIVIRSDGSVSNSSTRLELANQGAT